MNNATLYFASGESLYAGAALLLLAIAISPFLTRRWRTRARNIVCWLALCLMVIASVPLPPIVAALLLFSFVIWIVAINKPVQNRFTRALRILTSVGLAVFTLCIVTIELSHRKMPVISGASSDHLVVIGDSISAGIDPAVPAWPKVFQQTTGIPVKNLSVPGAQVNEGPFMAGKVTSEDRAIVIELGGNDLLSNVPAERFEKFLNLTLAQLMSKDRTLVMFELPLLPHKTSYGAIQRRLALQYHVWLIPKRKFIDVIGGAN